jgi:hypothetical protein
VNFDQPTAFDTWTGVASAALYLLVGVAALARAPKDSRTRAFFAVALASVTPYVLPTVMGRLGTGTLLTVATVSTAVSLAAGSVALFHFTQVFPSRRPWIQSHPLWLAAAYLVLPLGAAIGAVAAMPIVRTMSDVSAQVGAVGSGGGGVVADAAQPMDMLQALTLLAVLIPTIFVVGIVVPFAALLSLYRSWQEAKRDGRDTARVTTLAILVSQLAGGVLTILIVPLLHLIAPRGPLVTIAAAMLFGFGLLFPIAFAMGVWKYRLVLQAD